MKKIIYILIGLILLVLPIIVNASESEFDFSKYNTMNLDEVLEQEGIEKKYSSYPENDNQINIYLFRGNGCAYCKSFLNFLNNNVDELGKYFKLVSFESWYDDNNAQLLQDIADFKGKAAQGVPYIIIGDQVFAGYNNEYDESITNAIVSLYNENVEDRYDVFNEYQKSLDNESSNIIDENNRVIIWNIVIVLIVGTVILFYISYCYSRVNSKLDNICMHMGLTESSDGNLQIESDSRYGKKNNRKK